MTINTTKNSKRRTASEIIGEILNICTDLEIGKHVWHAEPIIGEPVLVDGINQNSIGVYKNPIGVRIERVREVSKPRNRFEEILQKIEAALEPVIVVPPLFEEAKVRWLTVDFYVGNRRLFSVKDSRRLRIFFRKDMSKLLSLLRSQVPEIINIRD